MTGKQKESVLHFLFKGFSLKFCFVLRLKVWSILSLLWKIGMIQYRPCEVI